MAPIVTGDSTAPRNILFIALQGVGNVLLTEPALAACRERYPKATITLLVRRLVYGEMLVGHPAVDEIATAGVVTLWHLRRRRFDLSITCFPANDWRFEAITRVIGARDRVGHSYPLRRIARIPGTYHRRVAVEEVDDAQQNLNLVGAGLVARPPQIEVTPVAVPGPVLGIHTGSSRARLMAMKRWPAGHFRAVIDRALVAVPELTVWLFAGPEEGDEVETVADGLGTRVEVIRGLSLQEVASRIAACTVFLANDSGLMHVAAACGVPTVAIFGPTDPRRTAPAKAWVVTHPVDCAPCWPLESTGRRSPCHRPEPVCLEGLTPEKVWQAVEQLLAQASGEGPARQVKARAIPSHG